jgi:hypothetical protein
MTSRVETGLVLFRNSSIVWAARRRRSCSSSFRRASLITLLREPASTKLSNSAFTSSSNTMFTFTGILQSPSLLSGKNNIQPCDLATTARSSQARWRGASDAASRSSLSDLESDGFQRLSQKQRRKQWLASISPWSLYPAGANRNQ